MTETPPARCAIVSLCSSERVTHLRNQLRAVQSRPGIQTIVVWIDGTPPPPLDADDIVLIPPGSHGMKLSAARNAGADRAIERGADLIVFLDADCIPGTLLVTQYAKAATANPRAILCGPVTYLPPGLTRIDSRSLAKMTNPHAARPAPPPGVVTVASDDEYRLFWSLSFAMSSEAWSANPKFHEVYEGYGGEDTDFAFSARQAGTPLVWVGGAHAYHQHHPTSSPPWQHLDDILRNGAIFAERWGQWPMTGWLNAFHAAGTIEFKAGAWRRTPQTPNPRGIESNASPFTDF